MLKTLKNKKAEGYIDVAVAVLVIALVLVLIISIWSMVTLKQDMTYMCNELLEVATVTGRIGPEVEARFAELCAESGFIPTVQFSATYFDYATGNGFNIVYFKWTVPDNSAGILFWCQGTINSSFKGEEQITDNNTTFFTFTAKSKVISQSPNTRYEGSAPSSYNPSVSSPTTSTGKATWTMWVYENGDLILKSFGLSITTRNPVTNADFALDVEQGETTLIEIGEYTVYYRYNEDLQEYCYIWNDGKYAFKIFSSEQFDKNTLKPVIDGLKIK